MSETPKGVPLIRVIKAEIIPFDRIKIPEDLGSFLERIIITRYEDEALDDGGRFEVDLSIEPEALLELPGIEGIIVVIGGAEGTIVTLSAELTYNMLRVRIGSGIRIRFSHDLLRPVTKQDGRWVELPPDQYSEILIGVDVLIDQDWNVTFDGPNEFTLQPSMIGGSGIVIEGTVLVDLSEGQSLPETREMGLSDTWRGVVFKTLTIHLPGDLNVSIFPDEIAFSNLHIGSGGISGTVSGTWNPQLNQDRTGFTGSGAGSIFGIPFALKEIDIEFRQNTLVKSKIEGVIILPFFDQPVVCEIGLTNDGDFTVAIATEQELPDGISQPQRTDDGFYVFTKEDLLELKLKSISFEKREGVLAIRLSGDIKPLFLQPAIEWPEVEIKSLTIDSTGRVSIEGGWLEIPKQKSFSFHGFTVEVTRIGFGTESDGSRWIGLSGGIQIVDGIPLKGGVEGLKIIWKDTDVRLEIKGIEVAFEIEDVLRFKGHVFFVDEPTKKGFRGGVRMIVYPLDGLSLDVQFIAGRNSQTPPYNFFYLYMGIELPIGVPLGSTGAALFGIAGLFGYNMIPNKLPEEEWYGDEVNPGYYLKGEKGVTSSSKWTDKRDALALGVGITLGTSADNGFTFSGKVLLVVLVPGPTILIEGKAQFLRERGDLDEEPLFRMLGVLDVKAGTFLFNVQASYRLPDDGKVLDINGIAEVFFNFNDPSKWHLYLGEDTPESKRIRATILGLFKANAYFMVDNERIVFGFWMGYRDSWKYGPLSVRLEVWMEGSTVLSWKPYQTYGEFTLHGNVQLKAFGIGAGLGISALMEVRTPKPFHVRGEFDVRLNLPWPLPDPEATVVLEWKEESEPPVPLPLAKVGIEHPKVTETWDLAKYPDYDTDRDGFEGDFNNTLDDETQIMRNSPVVPLDVYIALNFARPVKDGPMVGGNPAGVPPPEKVGRYKFEYILKSITLERRSKDNPDAPWSTVAVKSDTDPEAESMLKGMWQVSPGSTNSNTKLLLWAKTPFDISRTLESNHAWLYSILEPWQKYPFNIDTEPRYSCVDFDDLNIGASYMEFLLHNTLIFHSPHGTINIVKHKAEWAGTRNALELGSVRYCIDIAGTEEASNIKTLTINNITYHSITINGVVFGTTYNRIFSTYNGDNLFYVNKYGVIYFPEDEFPQGPDKVTVDCIRLDSSCIFKAYDSSDSQIDTFECSRNLSVNLSGNDIRRIEIIGNILIYSLCYEYKESNRLLVVFPDEMEMIVLYLSKKSKGTIKLFDRLNQVIGTKDFFIENQSPLSFEKGSIHALEIKGSFKVLKVCALTKEEVERVKYNTALIGHIKDFAEEWWNRHTVTLLEPRSYYKITVVTETKYRRPSGEWVTRTFTESAYFQTENPPGAFTPRNNSTMEPEHYPEGGPLKDLSPYIERTIPAGGAANEPKAPAYRSYDIGIVFNTERSHVEQMYLMAGLPLRIRLFDNTDEPVRNINGIIVELENYWPDKSAMILTREEKQWRKVLGESSYRLILEERTISETEAMYAGSRDLVLKPRTLYRARLCGGDYTIYSFSFITSAYCTFIHHIHSFMDVVWDYKRLYDRPETPLLDSNAMEVLTELLSSFNPQDTQGPEHFTPEIEAKCFEDIMNLFGIGNRKLPRTLEITLLNDDTRSYGLLLESPEPIDWHRVTMEIVYMNTNSVVEKASSSVKIIDAKIDASTDRREYNREYLDILLREDTDISGLRIEHRSLSGQPTDEFTEYYTFADNEGIKPAGTVLRIHSGLAPSEPDPDSEPLHRYRTAEGDSPQWCFDPAGETIRVLDAQGNLIHSRIFIPFTEEKKKFIIIRNSDMTRAFIFISSDTERFSTLTDGRYSISFKFERKIEGRETLMRMGSVFPEQTRIEFSLPALLP